MERRLRHLEVVYQRARTTPAPVFDFSGLTPYEQWELAQLLAEVERVQRRTGVGSVAMLTAQERERLDALLERVTWSE